MKDCTVEKDDIDLLQYFGASGVLLLVFAPIYIQSLRSGVRLVSVTEIKRKLREGGYQSHEREIVKLCRELGFSVAYPHNKAHVLVESEEKIRQVSNGAGFSRRFCEDLEEMNIIEFPSYR